jgi:hypothetical protein
MATIHPVGEAGLYHIHFLDGRVDPGYGRPGGGHPDNSLPGHGHPDNSLPGYGHPGNRPPGSGRPNFPDNSLPSGPPPHVPDGTVVVLVKDPAGVWHYASLPPGTPAPTPLPEQPAPTPT